MKRISARYLYSRSGSGGEWEILYCDNWKASFMRSVAEAGDIPDKALAASICLSVSTRYNGSVGGDSNWTGKGCIVILRTAEQQNRLYMLDH